MPRVIIVGGGFAGLSAARALRATPADVIVIDRTNHHLFQPLLYQVATAVLTPGQIASPLREILGRQRNATVIMAEVTGVDPARKRVFVTNADRTDVPLAYDYLILATGVRHSYFGHDDFAPFAPGLKSLADAVAVRNQILRAFEQAEAEEDPRRHRDLLTFVLVGAGPSGVEMAAAIAGLVRHTLRAQFRRLDPACARVVLVDMQPRVLGTFAEALGQAARARLEALGVELRLGHGVEHIDADGVIVAGERIASRTVIWTAGVAPSPAGKWLGAETDRAGRVRVAPDLSVPDHPEIFVIGDTASLDQDGRPLPGVAQVALQQGRYVGRLLHRRITGSGIGAGTGTGASANADAGASRARATTPAPFRYADRGNMAVVGQGFAVLESGSVHTSGLLTWFVWAGVHIRSLAQSRVRLSVLAQWIWTGVTRQRGSRLIVRHHE